MTDDAPLKPKVRPICAQKPMQGPRGFFAGAMDTETHDLDGRLLMAQAFHETWSDAALYSSTRPMLEDIFAMDPATLRKTIWFIHNIDYDLRYIFESLPAYRDIYHFECRQRCPGKFYEIVVTHVTLKDGKGRPLLITKFRDSMAIYEGPLSTFTKEFAPAYAKQDIGLGRGVLFNPKNPVHRDYARFDVIGLTYAVLGFDDMVFEHYQVHIRGTGSSTAYAAWLRCLPEDAKFWRQSPEKEEFFRRCYYGGLVQLNAKLGHEYPAVHVFDINSSYPAAMRLGVPAGNARSTVRYREDLPGFYHCTANVPLDELMPIIPSRRGNSLAWERGRFTAFLSSLEIEYGRERGFDIEVHEGYYFPGGLDFRFNNFVDKAEALRKAFKKTPTETVAKRMQNSLYGRFGMKREGEECVVSFDGPPDGFLPVIDEDTSAVVNNIYMKQVEREAEYMMPHVSAWITANARISIDRMCAHVGRENVLYRDTDSLHVIGSPDIGNSMCGAAYGLLKNEGQKFRIKYHGPKCYTYFDEKGEPHAVYKGLPAKLLEKDERDPTDEYLNRLAILHSGGSLEVTYHSSTSIKTFWAHKKMFYMRTRSSTRVDRVYSHVIENGLWRPRVSDGVEGMGRTLLLVYGTFGAAHVGEGVETF